MRLPSARGCACKAPSRLTLVAGGATVGRRAVGPAEPTAGLAGGLPDGPAAGLGGGSGFEHAASATARGSKIEERHARIAPKCHAWHALRNKTGKGAIVTKPRA
jgi:hypothetical protein